MHRASAHERIARDCRRSRCGRARVRAVAEREGPPPCGSRKIAGASERERGGGSAVPRDDRGRERTVREGAKEIERDRGERNTEGPPPLLVYRQRECEYGSSVAMQMRLHGTKRVWGGFRCSVRAPGKTRNHRGKGGHRVGGQGRGIDDSAASLGDRVGIAGTAKRLLKARSFDSRSSPQ